MDNNFFIEALDILVRSILSLTVLFVLTRLLGKKHISQLNFFDYVVGISIGSIAAAFAIDNTIDYEHGIVGLIVYSAFPLIISQMTLKSIKFRRIIDGTPTILIQNGKLVEENLKKAKFNVNEVLEECRLKGIFNLADVEFAILETEGKVSIQLKSQKAPVTPEDLSISTVYRGIPANLIIDGKIMYEHMKMVNLDEEWLLKQLRKHNAQSPDDVLLATLDTDGTLNVDLKNQQTRPYDVIE